MATSTGLKTFTVLNNDGATIFKSRGKAGAAQKAIDALYGYRAAVKSASGMLYGNPIGMGGFAVDGVVQDESAGLYGEDFA